MESNPRHKEEEKIGEERKAWNLCCFWYFHVDPKGIFYWWIETL